MAKGHDALREYLGDLHGAQARLARAAGIDPGVLSRIVKEGNTPSLPTASAIERVTGIPAASFVDASADTTETATDSPDAA